MDVASVEQLLRKVVREELGALLAGGSFEMPLPKVVPCPRPVEPVREGVSPFDLTDGALAQAESLLPEEERPILRMRVMAFRLAAGGNKKSAASMRKRADNIERKLAV